MFLKWHAGLVVLFFVSARGGQVEKQDASSMQKIQVWRDVKPFAGKCVAYRTKSDYLMNTEKGDLSTLGLSAGIGYGKISNGYTKATNQDYASAWTGYDLYRCIMANGSSLRYCVLSDLRLKNSDLEMREIMEEELNVLEQAFDKKKIFLEKIKQK